MIYDVRVPIFRSSPYVELPRQMSASASGFDLIANLGAKLILQPFTPEKIPTGIHLAVPRGVDAQIRPRSGLSSKGIWAAIGTIDSDFVGQISVTLINLTNTPYTVEPSHRIGQLVFTSLVGIEWDEVPTQAALGKTQRGEGGHGSTGS